MATPAPYCGFQGPSESSGELNFEFTCGKILLLQSPLRHEEIQRASRTPVLGVFAIAIIVDLQMQQRIVVAVFKTKEIFPLHQSRSAEQFAEAGMVVGTVRKAETADRLTLGCIKRGLFFTQPQVPYRAAVGEPGFQAFIEIFEQSLGRCVIGQRPDQFLHA
jgi:hypothetical protein